MNPHSEPQKPDTDEPTKDTTDTADATDTAATTEIKDSTGTTGSNRTRKKEDTKRNADTGTGRAIKPTHDAETKGGHARNGDHEASGDRRTTSPPLGPPAPTPS
ncbi:hypothetical protein MUU72_24215, partial [Streptomyces sp. RS10V-4]|uniref:hypothetical protein n=1 Tax=Streptomyces rhizoryzae TaxID=2932493 RepID=UPI002005AEAC